MKQKLVILASVLTLALSAAPEASAQWVQANADFGASPTICFAESNGNIFAGAQPGSILLSTDSGKNWTDVSPNLTGDICALEAVGSNLFAGFTNRGVYLSTNNGASWASDGLVGYSVQSFANYGPNLFAATDEDVVYLSTNKGSSWSATRYWGTTVTTLTVKGPNIFAGTDDGVFLSTNNGTSWVELNNGLPANTIVQAFIVQGTNLYLGTPDSGVFLSTDNGSNWTPVNIGLGNNNALFISSLAVSGANIFAGTLDGVFQSTDNGTNWIAVDSGLTNLLVTSLFVFDSNLFAGTSGIIGGSIWRRLLSEMIPSSSIAEQRSISSEIQAYPNPLTQSTTINFTSQESGAAEITVVNLLGAEVARIYSGELDAGTHSFVWDKPTGLPPGTYWCEIRMNGTANQIPVVVQR